MAPLDVNHIAPSDLTAAWWPHVQRLASLPVLTIAAVRGIARGGGANVAAALDIRFASREWAKVAQIEVGVGVVPGGGGLEMLPRLMGRARTLEMVMSADAEFEGFVDRFARRVAGWDGQAIAAAKELVNKRTGFPPAEERQESFGTFGKLVSNPNVLARLDRMRSAGLGTDLAFELRFPEELVKYIGNN